MSIDRLFADSASRSYVQQAQLARANSAAAGASDDTRAAAKPQPRVDSVMLSANAKSLAAARDAVQQSDGDFRQARVAEIKQRIGDGTYAVDSRVLARKMLSDSQ